MAAGLAVRVGEEKKRLRGRKLRAYKKGHRLDDNTGPPVATTYSLMFIYMVNTVPRRTTSLRGHTIFRPQRPNWACWSAFRRPLILAGLENCDFQTIEAISHEILYRRLITKAYLHH